MSVDDLREHISLDVATLVSALDGLADDLPARKAKVEGQVRFSGGLVCGGGG